MNTHIYYYDNMKVLVDPDQFHASVQLQPSWGSCLLCLFEPLAWQIVGSQVQTADTCTEFAITSTYVHLMQLLSELVKETAKWVGMKLLYKCTYNDLLFGARNC